jgi:peptide methionine sulfoxide reductase MsrB
MSRDIPEPSLTPPDDGVYIMADCGHEVFEGESLIEWDNKTLCPDCFWDKVKEMTIEEIADHLDCTVTTVVC